MAIRYGQEVKDEFNARRAGGTTISQVCRDMGLSHFTGTTWERERKGNVASAVKVDRKPAAEDHRDMEIASLKARLKRHERASVNVVPEMPDEEQENPSEVWRRAEVDCDRRIERARKSSRFHARLDSSLPVGITFPSDQHIAPGTPVALRRMREDAELIAATDGMYAVLGGDATDNHIKHKAATIAARSQPSDQLTLFDYYVSIFLEKILVVISGNHDAWTNQIAGLDPLAILASNRKFHYSPFVARISVAVGDQSYNVSVRHQYKMNSVFNQTHAVKQWLRLGEEEFDVGVLCHHHEPAVEDFLYRGTSRIAIRPGSYQILSAYSVQYGWNMTTPTCPTVILWPGERQMLAVPDVRLGAKILTQLRGG